MDWLTHSREFARVDARRTRRKLADKPLQVVVYVVLFGVLALGPGYLAYRLGGEFAAGLLGDGADSVGALRGFVGAFWTFIVFMIALRSVGKRGTLSHPEGVLTTIPTREAALGVLLAESTYVVPWTAVPGLGVGVGLAAATGEVTTVLTVPLAAVLVGVTAVAVGYPVGLGVRHVLSQFEFVARNKSALIVVAFAAYFLFISSGQFNQVMASLYEPMQSTPMGWFADLATVGFTPLAGNALRAGVALGAAAVAFAASAVVTTAIAGRHWLSDPVLAGASEERTETADTGDVPGPVERRLADVIGRPTASLVVLAWRRAGRAPMKLLYAAYPLLFLTGVFADILQTGEIPAYLPYGILVFVVWAVSVVFTLNPLGDQGAVLPTTLLSRVDGREFVVAHVLAGLVVGLPVGTAVTAAVAFLSPVDVETAVALTAATPVLQVVCSVLAVGIGVAFPRYEAVNVTRSMKAVVPSRWAFVIFTLYLFLATAAVVVVAEPVARDVAAVVVTFLLPFGLSVSAEALLYAAGGSLVLLVLAPVASYRYAVRRFERYTVA